MNAESCRTTADCFEAGRAWMRASLAERPADPEQQRKLRILLAPARRAAS